MIKFKNQNIDIIDKIENQSKLYLQEVFHPILRDRIRTRFSF